MGDNKRKPDIRFQGFTDDWEQRKFSDLVLIERGGSPRPIDDYITDLPDGLNWVKIGDAPSQGRYITKTAEKIKPEGLSKTRQVQPGDLILSNSMSFGKPYIMGINGCIHDGWLLIRDTQNRFDLKFLCHMLGTDQMLNQYRMFAAGSTVNNLNKELVGNTTVSLPSVGEQRVIGEYLESVDDLITLQQRKCDKLVNVKKSMLEKMFAREGAKVPEIRFEGFTDDWEQRKFVSVFEGLQNNTLSRADLNYENGTVKNVHYGDVLIKFGDYIDASRTDLPYISDDAKADKFKNSFLQDGDIIIADTAEDDTVGKCTEIQGSEGLKLLSGLHTVACRPKEKYGPMFLGYYINSPAYHNQLKPLMQGIKVTSISKSALQDTDMIMPKSIEEQTMIGGYFANLDSLITLQQCKS